MFEYLSTIELLAFQLPHNTERTSCEKCLVGGSRIRNVLRDNSKDPCNDDRNSTQVRVINNDCTRDTIQDNTNRVSNGGDDTLQCGDSEPGIDSFASLPSR